VPDFALVNSYTVPMARVIAEWNPTPDELDRLTIASIDRFLALLAHATDADVTFVPDDPHALDGAAADPADRHLAWSVAHNIAHATASGEEYAAVAAELARGVEFHGRPRFETPWQTVTTVEACRQRLEESRRMRRASLLRWSDDQHHRCGRHRVLHLDPGPDGRCAGCDGDGGRCGGLTGHIHSHRRRRRAAPTAPTAASAGGRHHPGARAT
jgi:hypothetical protein